MVSVRLRNVRNELKHNRSLADILHDFAKAEIRTNSKELRGKNARVICGGLVSERQVCIEHDGAVKCAMCIKRFADSVAMLNHLLNARRNNLQAFNMQLGAPAYNFRFGANNQLVPGPAAAEELRVQPAEDNNIPLRE